MACGLAASLTVLRHFLFLIGRLLDAAALLMSHAHALSCCRGPLAAVCRFKLRSTKGLVARGNIADSLSASRPAHQRQSVVTVACSAGRQHPQQITPAAADGVHSAPAAMADIRTMLIDLDDCLYDIPVSVVIHGSCRAAELPLIALTSDFI